METSRNQQLVSFKVHDASNGTNNSHDIPFCPTSGVSQSFVQCVPVVICYLPCCCHLLTVSTMRGLKHCHICIEDLILPVVQHICLRSCGHGRANVFLCEERGREKDRRKLATGTGTSPGLVAPVVYLCSRETQVSWRYLRISLSYLNSSSFVWYTHTEMLHELSHGMIPVA